MRRRYILEAWNELMSRISLENRIAYPKQIETMKRYYFLGAFAVFQILIKQLGDERNEATREEDRKMVDDVYNEIMEMMGQFTDGQRTR
jgi:hypothetical protein